MDYPDPAPRLDMAPIVERCASLGVNCEFGLVQRWCGIEPLGLFRFGMTPLDGLIAGLHSSFAGLEEPALIEITAGFQGEHVTRHALYDFEFHTAMLARNVDEGTVLKRMARERFPLLARMLREDLASGEKLFVFRAEEGSGDAEAWRLLEAIRRHGPGTLLWVTLAREPAEVGTAVRRGDGLIVGYLDRLAPLRFARALSFEPWLAVCRAAYGIWQEGRGTL